MRMEKSKPLDASKKARMSVMDWEDEIHRSQVQIQELYVRVLELVKERDSIARECDGLRRVFLKPDVRVVLADKLTKWGD